MAAVAIRSIAMLTEASEDSDSRRPHKQPARFLIYSRYPVVLLLLFVDYKHYPTLRVFPCSRVYTFCFVLT